MQISEIKARCMDLQMYSNILPLMPQICCNTPIFVSDLQGPTNWSHRVADLKGYYLAGHSIKESALIDLRCQWAPPFPATLETRINIEVVAGGKNGWGLTSSGCRVLQTQTILLRRQLFRWWRGQPLPRQNSAINPSAVFHVTCCRKTKKNNIRLCWNESHLALFPWQQTHAICLLVCFGAARRLSWEISEER